jgi:hypothetical protein
VEFLNDSNERQITMAEFKKGSRGAAVRKLQLQLNTRLKPGPRLKPDGFFGAKTEGAVRLFQTQNRLPVTGIAGDKTLWALNHPMPDTPPPPNLGKFVAQLGTAADFVNHVKAREAALKTKSALITELADFVQTSGGRRYLLVEGDSALVVDFRHFFAAMAESYSSEKSRRIGVALGGSPGSTVLLGVANEVSQCVSEGIERKLNSCFSREDLGSNRLGADFGERLRIKDAEATRLPVSQHLGKYLDSLKPVAPERVNQMRAPTGWHTVVEVLSAIASGLGDLLVSRAY